MAQRGRTRAAAIAGGAAVLAGVAYWIVVELEPLRHEATSFEIPASCAASSRQGPRSNSMASEWSDGTLTVRTSVCINCRSNVASVTAQVLGDRVLLKIRSLSPGAYAQCDCEHPLVIRLGQLPQRDYKIMGVPMYTECE